MENLLISMN